MRSGMAQNAFRFWNRICLAVSRGRLMLWLNLPYIGQQNIAISAGRRTNMNHVAPLGSDGLRLYEKLLRAFQKEWNPKFYWVNLASSGDEMRELLNKFLLMSSGRSKRIMLQ
jgi:hypothetical protein